MDTQYEYGSYVRESLFPKKQPYKVLSSSKLGNLNRFGEQQKNTIGGSEKMFYRWVFVAAWVSLQNCHLKDVHLEMVEHMSYDG